MFFFVFMCKQQWGKHRWKKFHRSYEYPLKKYISLINFIKSHQLFMKLHKNSKWSYTYEPHCMNAFTITVQILYNYNSKTVQVWGKLTTCVHYKTNNCKCKLFFTWNRLTEICCYSPTSTIHCENFCEALND